MRLFPSVAALAIVTGCASQATPPALQVAAATPAASEAAATNAPPQQVCVKEYPTGSNLPRTVCHEADSAVQREALKSQLQNAVNQPRPGPIGH